MAHRSVSQRSMHSLTRRSPLHLRTAIIRARPIQVNQARQLWWWSRKHHSEYQIDDEQERFLRQQKHIRNRYAKIIRRRAMWDRDPTPNPWPWQRRRSERLFQDLHNHTSNERPIDRAPKNHADSIRDSLKTFHNDFDSFRKAVDRAMDRDPYGTLFGRRLWSPPSTNNSSWTSFSWIFDPKEIKEDTVDASKTRQATASSSKPNSTAETSRTVPQQPPQAPMPVHSVSSTGMAAAVLENVEYEYDPISMRKVPKTSAAPNAHQPEMRPANVTEAPQTKSTSVHEAKPAANKIPSNAAEDSVVEPQRRTIFETLFGENSVDIPVKTYSPKVYGYNAKTTSEKAPQSKPEANRFETSRQREFQALKAATLGSTIDTTAEFFGKYNPEPKTAATPQANKTTADGDEALFAGTTYEGKVDQITGRSPVISAEDKSPQQSAADPKDIKSAWLEQEGFTTGTRESSRKGFNQMSFVPDHGKATNIPIKKYTSVEPSLTRLNSQLQTKTDRLRPSLDRSAKDPHPSHTSSRSEWEDKIAAAEKAEDIDLLRTRDVRASMKADRTTKQDVEDRKKQTRERLETDFVARQADMEEAQMPKPATLSGLDHIWKHVEKNRDGIVARTIRSMSVFNDNFKKYVRSENDLNAPLPASAESSVKAPMIYNPPKPLCVPTAPSKQVVNAVEEKSNRLATLQQRRAEKMTRAAVENEKFDKLAKEIKGIYEEEFGNTGVQDEPQKTATIPKPHPLSSATVKEGVTQDPVIESHIHKFEPSFARLVDEMKDVRRNIHATKLNIKDLRESIRKKSWSELEAARLAEYASENLVEEDASATSLDGPVFAEPKNPSEDIVESLDQPVPKVEPVKRDTDPKGLDEPFAPSSKMAADLRAQAGPVRTVEEPFFTPSGSPVWNDEQPPPIAELKAATTEFKSPVVILVYDFASKAVRAIPSPNLPTVAPRDNLNPFSLLAGLDVSQAGNFLSYFPRLQNAGYELVDGDKDKLIFRKPIQQSASPQSSPVKQPVPEKKVEAATVLNEFPAEIDPPGPSAPIPPPSSYPTSPTRSRRQPRVRRQETIFSGTTTAPTIPIESSAKQAAPTPPSPPDSDPSYDYETQTPKPGFFNRVARAVRRVTLTVLALAGGAYTIGFIAEGIGAQEQANKGVRQADPEGPRKKIVLPQVLEASENWKRGTRPGIYSTESSRRD